MVTSRTSPAPAVPVAVAAALVLVMTTGALVVYKISSAIKALTTARVEHALHAKQGWLAVADAPAAARPVIDSLNYLSWVGIALAFGILIAATVRALVPARWLERTVAVEGIRGQVIAALVGAPLMLCSCCIAPVFETLYARTRRLGPSLGVMLAAPGLNPAVLAATFLIFPAAVGWLRLGAALVLVLFASVALAQVERDPRMPEACSIDVASPSLRGLPRAFLASLAVVAKRSLPAIIIGIVASMAIAGWMPVADLAVGSTSAVIVVVVVAAIAVPLALPTFGEIPLALALIAAGAPMGAAAALLVAGPTVNLPSLLALGRATSWRVAVATAGAVFAAAVAVGFAALAL